MIRLRIIIKFIQLWKYINAFTRNDISNTAQYIGKNIINKNSTKKVVYNGKIYKVVAERNGNGAFISNAPPVGNIYASLTSFAKTSQTNRTLLSCSNFSFEYSSILLISYFFGTFSLSFKYSST